MILANTNFFQRDQTIKELSHMHDLDHNDALHWILVYSCFEKGCPTTKPYATMPKGIMGNGGLWYLLEALGVSAT